MELIVGGKGGGRADNEDWFVRGVMVGADGREDGGSGGGKSAVDNVGIDVFEGVEGREVELAAEDDVEDWIEGGNGGGENERATTGAVYDFTTSKVTRGSPVLCAW